MLDGVNVSSWAQTQKAIAMSSGESELYAMSVGAAEALGLRELLTDIGLSTTVRLRCDSTAASHETCVTECTPVSRPETWSSTVTTRHHVCWNVVFGMWTDGRNGTPVYWYVDRWKERCTCVLVGFRHDWNALAERHVQCKA